MRAFGIEFNYIFILSTIFAVLVLYIVSGNIYSPCFELLYFCMISNFNCIVLAIISMYTVHKCIFIARIILHYYRFNYVLSKYPQNGVLRIEKPIRIKHIICISLSGETIIT